jgi:adenosylcobinamide-GDP ribazoletransferase
MWVLKSLVIAFSMFSRLPLPQIDWNEKSLRWMMAFFPLVGAVVGGAILLWSWAAEELGLGPFLRGAGFALVPLMITGGIHLDGYCDTVDALASHAGPEKRRAILDDPHTGAFASIGVAAYLLGFAALGSELKGDLGSAGVFALVFVLSRCLSGLAVVSFPCAPGSSLARAFADGAARKATGVILSAAALLTVGIMVRLGGAVGIAAAAAVFGVFGVYRIWLIGQFGGLSGDLAGWFVQVCELCALGSIILAVRITGGV